MVFKIQSGKDLFLISFLMLQTFADNMITPSLFLAISIWINLWPDVAMAQGRIYIKF